MRNDMEATDKYMIYNALVCYNDDDDDSVHFHN